MKLSDIKGDRTLEVIAEIIDPIANIAEDEAAAALFRREKLPKGMSPKKLLLDRARKSVPVLLKNHKADIISILSIIDGTSPEQYKGALNMVKLFKDCTELLTDDAFQTLFISAQGEEEGNSSGSAPENTEDMQE